MLRLYLWYKISKEGLINDKIELMKVKTIKIAVIRTNRLTAWIF